MTQIKVYIELNAIEKFNLEIKVLNQMIELIKQNQNSLNENSVNEISNALAEFNDKLAKIIQAA